MSEVLQAVVGITHSLGGAGRALGSGFIVRRSGVVVTNAHVVAGTLDVQVILRDGSKPWARVAVVDAQKDLAIVRLQSDRDLATLTLGRSSDLSPGDPVWAVGFPLGEELGFTVTKGVVGGIRKALFGRDAIQHDAAINPGNSGGPLLDARFNVVGINTWKLAEADRLGFAIPVEEAVALLESVGE
jgi:putative serine protease PepD